MISDLHCVNPTVSHACSFMWHHSCNRFTEGLLSLKSYSEVPLLATHIRLTASPADCTGVSRCGDCDETWVKWFATSSKDHPLKSFRACRL